MYVAPFYHFHFTLSYSKIKEEKKIQIKNKENGCARADLGL